MKKLLILLFIASFILAGLYSTASECAEESQAKSDTAPKGTPPLLPPRESPPGNISARPNFSVVFGTITKVDTQDPAKPKLEVKSSADETLHSIELSPWTNITKVSEVTDLKAGDTVRVMTRKVDDKEVAMGVVFGKIKNILPPKPVMKQVPEEPANIQPTAK